MKTRHPTLVSLFAAAALLTACQSPPTQRDTGMVIGGILGGVLGHEVGGGRGRTVATIIGTLIGASIGGAIGDGEGSWHGVPASRRQLTPHQRPSPERTFLAGRVMWRTTGPGTPGLEEALRESREANEASLSHAATQSAENRYQRVTACSTCGVRWGFSGPRHRNVKARQAFSFAFEVQVQNLE
jgi:hypothetical protein